MLDAIAHAKQEYPKESCGLVAVFKGKETYYPCKNCAIDPLEDFYIKPIDWLRVSQLGDIIEVVHSHPKSPLVLTPSDELGLNSSSVPWVIIDPTSGEFVTFQPKRSFLLVGQEYTYGESDCYTLVQQYYANKLNIKLKDYTRGGTVECDAENILQGLNNDGFVRVNSPKEHDLLFFNLEGALPHHMGVYLNNNKILHHLRGRLSSRDSLSRLYLENLWGCYRHLDLLD